jgi:hypothetical protein
MQHMTPFLLEISQRFALELIVSASRSYRALGFHDEFYRYLKPLPDPLNTEIDPNMNA